MREFDKINILIHALKRVYDTAPLNMPGELEYLELLLRLRELVLTNPNKQESN